MKKVILIFTVLLFFIGSCGNNKSGEDASSSQDTENQKEIEAIDSTINEMEIIQKEIEESAQKVDEQINDL